MPPPQRLDANMTKLYFGCTINVRLKCYQSTHSQPTIAMLSMLYYTTNGISMLHRHWVPALIHLEIRMPLLGCRFAIAIRAILAVGAIDS